MVVAGSTHHAIIQREMGKPEMKTEYLEAFRAWINKQPHLPKVDDDLLLILFLKRCRFSIEKAKVKFDNYFTFRTRFPELSVRRTLDNPEIREFLEISETAVLRAPDRNGNLVILQRLKSLDPTHFSPGAGLRIFQTLIESYTITNGTIPGYVMVFDQTGFGLSHLSKATFTVCKQFMFFIQKCAPVSIKGVHVINGNSFMETTLSFIKSVTQGNMVSKIEVYPEGKLEAIFKYIPKEIVPNDYGGEGGYMADLNREAYECIERMRDFTEERDSLVVDEKKRIGTKNNIDSIFGMQGSFKKLDVD